MRTTVLFNAKGGVAKTTTAVNMAAELAARGKRVCIVDADPQCNASEFLAPTHIVPEWTLYDLMTSLRFYHYEAYPTRIENVSLVFGDERLTLADLAALQKGGVRLSALRELAEEAAERDAYDFILVDCPPGFTAATVSALAAADDVVVPLKLDAFSIRGEESLMRQIEGMREFNPKLRVAGVVVTMDDPNTVVSRQGLELLRESAVPVFRGTIRRAEAVNKATFTKTPLRMFPEARKIAEDYADFVTEYLEGGAARG